MRHEDDRRSVFDQLSHPLGALGLKAEISDGEDLVDQENVGSRVRRNAEAKACVHAARIPLHGGVKERLQSGELHDLIEAVPHLAAGHTQDRTVKEYVLPPCQVRVKTGPELNER